MKAFIIALLCLSIYIPALAQGSFKIDSLEKQLAVVSNDHQKIKVLKALANQLARKSKFKLAQKYYTELIALCKRLKNQEELADAYLKLGRIYREKGQYAQAKAQYQQAKSIVFKLKNQQLIADYYAEFGIIHEQQGRYEQAKKCYNASLKIYKKTNNQPGIASTLNNIGIIHDMQGKYTEALKYYSQSLKIDRQLNREYQQASTLTNIGIVQLLMGNYEQSRKYLFKSLKIKEKIGNKRGSAITLLSIGTSYSDQANYPKALKNLLKSLAIAQKIGDNRIIAYGYNNIASIYLLQENYPKALENLSKSLKINRKMGDQIGISSNYQETGDVYQRQKKYHFAKEYFNKSLEIRKKIGNEEGIASSYLALGELAIRQKAYDNAITYYTKALESGKVLNSAPRIAHAQVGKGIALHYQKKPQQALEHLDQGMKIAKKIGNPFILKLGVAALAKTHETLGNFKKAYQAQILYKNLSDSLFNKENTAKITRLQAEFDFQKTKDSINFVQEKKQIAFDKELEKQKITQRDTSIVLGTVSLLLLIMGWLYISKRKVNKKLSTTHQELNLAHYELSYSHEQIQIAQEDTKAVNEVLQRTLKVAREQRDQIKEHRDSMQDSIRYARRIQQAILPSTRTLEEALPEHFIFFRPRDVVSGDFYWFSQVPSRPVYEEVSLFDGTKRVFKGFSNELKILAAIDCTGHGVPGAFMSMIANDLLNYIVNEKHITEADKILNHLNREVVRALHQDETQNTDGMDMTLVVIDEENKTMQFAGAKNSLAYFQNGIFKHIRGNRFGVGGDVCSKVFTKHTISLESPVTFYMHSDGFQDQFGGPKNKKFLRSRLYDMLNHMYTQSMEAQEKTVNDTLDLWMQGQDQIDDILVVGAKVG
ncbi:hypothetical protein BKI52_42410 [marine bacterium AO1-C]|nr:hypothetical protein BKI52_42410 [marine bacterium AO1-C]